MHRFDALGDGLELETFGQLDDGLAQPGIDAIDMAVCDIAPVDLELAERQLPQPRQRRVAGAEIVERERTGKRTQLIGDVVGDLEILHRLVLGDFEDETRPGRRAGPLLAQYLRDRQLDESRHRHIDREFHRRAERRAILEVAQRRDNDALGQSEHVGFLGAGQKQCRTDHAAVRPARPHQTLGADETLRAQIDLGLVPQFEPIAPQHVAQRNLAVAGPGFGLRHGRLRREHCAQSLEHGETSSSAAEFAGREGDAPLMAGFRLDCSSREVTAMQRILTCHAPRSRGIQ